MREKSQSRPPVIRNIRFMWGWARTVKLNRNGKGIFFAARRRFPTPRGLLPRSTGVTTGLFGPRGGLLKQVLSLVESGLTSHSHERYHASKWRLGRESRSRNYLAQRPMRDLVRRRVLLSVKECFAEFSWRVGLIRSCSWNLECCLSRCQVCS